jgi:putative flippase GtrA
MISPHFIRFAVIGAAGFVVDASCLSLSLALGAGFWLGRLISYLCAATFTWAANRRWNFRDSQSGAFTQWGKFLVANSAGGAINYGVYIALIYLLPSIFGAYPVLAVGCGSIAGLVVNFTLSKKFVFRNLAKLG